jgi:hypothetical protein
MPGYTKEQLAARGATLSHYMLCDLCNLYWHKRAFKRHLRPAPPAAEPKEREIAIVHPSWDNFFDFLTKTAIKHWMVEAEKMRRGESFELAAPKSSAKIDWPPPSADDPELLTVDEAVVRLGVSREEILAEFEKNKIPFEFTVPPGPRRARGRSAAKPTPKP